MSVSTAQQPAGEGIVWNHRNSIFRGQWEQLALDLPEQQVVTRLRRNKPRHLQGVLPSERPGQTVGEEIRYADIARLARADDRVHRCHHFVERRCGIVHVQLIKIDVISLEATERGLNGVQNVLSRIARVPDGGTHRAAAFGRKDKSASLVAEPAAGNDFRAADFRTGRIDVGGVDEVDAGLGDLVEHFVGFCFTRLLSECSCAEDHPGNHQASLAEFRELHWNSRVKRRVRRASAAFNDDEYHCY